MSEIETGKSNPSKTFIAFLKYKYGDNLIPNDEYKTKTRRLSDKLGKPDTREGILELFNDRQAARKINLSMAEMERKDPGVLREIKGYLRGIGGALNNKPGNK